MQHGHESSEHVWNRTEEEEDQVFSYSNSQPDSERASSDGEEESFRYPGASTAEATRRESEQEESYAQRFAGILGNAADSPSKATSDTLDDSALPSASSPKPAAHDESYYTAPLAEDSFTAQLPTSHSIPESLASSTVAFPRRPATHPNISRLRSTSTQFQRFPSTSSRSTLFDSRNFDSPASSGFDRLSRRSSTSNVFDVPGSDLVTPEPTTPATVSLNGLAASKTFKWSTLRRISARIYPPIPKSTPGLAAIAGGPSGLMGMPTVLAVSGVVAVGTDKGWVGVFDFGQNLKCVCGTEAIARESGAVTALAISQDHTFIAVGHALGSIHLYSLAKPSTPSRSVLPTTLPLVLTGRKEGHLVGSRILHLGFVGARHTAIVSSDSTGLAFYHSLGKVLMLASTDIIRMLGRYPDPTTLPSASDTPTPLPSISNGDESKLTTKSKRPSTILDMAPLPLGPSPHSSDDHSLVALLTPTKLVVVGLKPTPRTWWRATPSLETDSSASTSDEARTGVLAWYPSFPAESSPQSNGSSEKNEAGDDPLLIFSWGKRVRLVRVQRSLRKTEEKGSDVEFVETKGWTCDSPVLAIQWYNAKVVCILTGYHVDVYDITTQQRIGRDSLDLRSMISLNNSSAPSSLSASPLSYSSTFKTYKRKVFLLTAGELRAGAILSWADRILTLMQPGTILVAIEVTTAYLLGHVDASTIGLPDDPLDRRDVVEPKLREILAASLEFVFSDDRLRDGTHSDGATMQQLLESLVGTCVRACLATGDVEWLFDDLYERYEQNGIEAIFLDRIEPFVLSGSVHALPPTVSQRLIAIHEERGQYESAQRIIWHVDPEALDINQALSLCQRQHLYDALIYVYTRSMHDYISPIVELLALVRQIQQHRKSRPRWVGEGADESFTRVEDVEATVPDAYKIFAYLSQALAGLSYPSGDLLVYAEAIAARNSIYGFVFSGRSRSWPEKGGTTILTSDDESAEPPYPYLQLLLKFDAEAMLDALDLAFEESYLEDDIPGKSLNRQIIVDLLLEVMTSHFNDFTLLDRTFLHIFVARNLPKYPQYIKLAPTVLQSILVGLASNEDQSTIEDRQLAVEYLLSCYTPLDGEKTVAMFEKAGFFRVLRSIYRGERKWGALASTYLRDPDVGADVFGFLRDTLQLANRTSPAHRQELADIIIDAIPSLVQADEAGLEETAELVDTFLPSHHTQVIERLAPTPWRQFAYLRFLLEPAVSSSKESSSFDKERLPSSRVETPQRLQYLSLLCAHEADGVIRFLESDAAEGIVGATEVVRICEEAQVFDALIWTLNRAGDTKGALDRVDDTLRSRAALLVQSLSEEQDENEGSQFEEDTRTSAEVYLDQIGAITKVAIDVCARRNGVKAEGGMSGEDLWFRVISSLVATVQSIKAVCPTVPTTRHDRASSRRLSSASIIYHDDPLPLSTRASDLLSSLIPNALSSLVSTTSTRDVSFPNLMRRLIDSNARSPAADRSYSEFKTIVTSMLDSYVLEGDLLTITSKISAQDLFLHVEELKEERDIGWRASSGSCAECCRPVWGQGDHASPTMSRSASANVVVESLGLTGRPRMEKRPSLKGKEVEWPGSGVASVGNVVLRPPAGVVVGRAGGVWHESCHLLSKGRRE